MKWYPVNILLWIPDYKGDFEFYCPKHHEVLLGYEKDLSEKE
jgi:hypothetical protein